MRNDVPAIGLGLLTEDDLFLSNNVRRPIKYGKIPSKWEKSQDDSRDSSFFRRLSSETIEDKILDSPK
jgi:hypothetical protein